MIEKQARINVVREIDAKLQTSFMNNPGIAFVAKPFILTLVALRAAKLDIYVLTTHLEYFARSADQEIQPIGVLGRGSLVRPFILCDMERVFVAINDQRHLGDVALVEPVTGDPAFGGPPSQMAGALAKPVSELHGLACGLAAKTAKRL
jgi:hypothetical protein